MNVTGTYIFNASAAAVWDLLMNPDALAACMPGCERLTPTGADTYEALVSVGVGPIRGKFTAKLALRDKQPPRSFILAVDGNSSMGFANGISAVTLAENGGKTTVTVDSDASAGGAIARVGQRMIANVAKTQLDKLFTCLQGRV